MIFRYIIKLLTIDFVSTLFVIVKRNHLIERYSTDHKFFLFHVAIILLEFILKDKSDGKFEKTELIRIFIF